MSIFLRSFRLSCRPGEIPLAEKLLQAQGFRFEPDPFFSPARRLTHEPFPLGKSLAAFFGLVYIQDRSSMLPPVALDPPRGAAVLDMCASPGSKTGQLAAMTGPEGFVLGNEPSAGRLVTLRRNMSVLNLPQVGICCFRGEETGLPGEAWDHIQLDPPCSGWGTVERNPHVMDIWKDDKITPLIRLQRALLREAQRLLRPGGVLVYSTCTTNVRENEDQIVFARDEIGLDPQPLPALSGFVPSGAARGLEGVWRLEPGDGQGFFIARLQKKGAAPVPLAPLPPERRLRFDKAGPALLAELGLEESELPGPVGIFDGSLHALPRQALDLLPNTTRWQGMYLGKAGKNGEVRLSPRVRLGGRGLRADLEGEDGIRRLQGLLQGQSLPCADFPLSGGGAGKSVLLRWEGLPLGRALIKNKRLLWAER